MAQKGRWQAGGEFQAGHIPPMVSLRLAQAWHLLLVFSALSIFFLFGKQKDQVGEPVKERVQNDSEIQLPSGRIDQVIDLL